MTRGNSLFQVAPRNCKNRCSSICTSGRLRDKQGRARVLGPPVSKEQAGAGAGAGGMRRRDPVLHPDLQHPGTQSRAPACLSHPVASRWDGCLAEPWGNRLLPPQPHPRAQNTSSPRVHQVSTYRSPPQSCCCVPPPTHSLANTSHPCRGQSGRSPSTSAR